MDFHNRPEKNSIKLASMERFFNKTKHMQEMIMFPSKLKDELFGIFIFKII